MHPNVLRNESIAIFILPKRRKEGEAMNYSSTYLWEKGKEEEKNPISLVLQQVLVRKQAVLLGCVYEGSVEDGGYFTEALVEWFHRECLELLEKKWNEAQLERSLRKEVEHALEEIKERKSLMGILLAEQRFWMFSLGKGQAYVINRRYNRKNIRALAESGEGLIFQSGNIQKRLGLLLCTKEFWGKVKPKEVAEVLLKEGAPVEEQQQKRLNELWEAGGLKEAGESAGVVFLRTC